MNPLRTMLPAVCVATLLGAAATASATTEPTAPNAAPAQHGWHDEERGPGTGLHRILDELNLTTGQSTQIASIFAQARSKMQAVHEDGRANREQLEVTAPTDPAYAGLLASAKSNAVEHIQLMSDLWTQVYGILTPDQRARIPGIAAAHRAEWDSHKPGQPKQPSAQ
jgi:Spy/CpxP family protein refolding chaperone